MPYSFGCIGNIAYLCIANRAVPPFPTHRPVYIVAEGRYPPPYAFGAIRVRRSNLQPSATLLQYYGMIHKKHSRKEATKAVTGALMLKIADMIKRCENAGGLLIDHRNVLVCFIEHEEEDEVHGLYTELFCKAYLRNRDDSVGHSFMDILRLMMSLRRVEDGMNVLKDDEPVFFTVVHDDDVENVLWIGLETPDHIKVGRPSD